MLFRSLRLVKERMGKDVEAVAEQNAQERILDALIAKEKGEKKADRNPIEALLGPVRKPDEPPEERESRRQRRERLQMDLLCGALEGEIIEIEVEDNASSETLPGTDVSPPTMRSTSAWKRGEWLWWTVWQSSWTIT